MNYEKQEFKNGQVLTAECLNRMEEGIKGACEAVPPTCDSADCSKVLSYGANGFEWIDKPTGGGGSAEGAILYTPQTLTPEQQAQARTNIGAAAPGEGGGGSVDAVPLVAPRAQVRQLKHFIEADGQTIMFEDVYALCSNGSPHIAGRCRYIYALEAHGVSSTTQRVFKSVDGETWSVLATLPIDATNGVWYTDLFVQKASAKVDETLILLKTTNGFSQTQNKLCTAIWNGESWYASEKLDLGNRRWLSNNTSIDECVNAAWTERAIIFGEYATTTDGTSYSLWKSTTGGATWKKVLELNGDSGGTALNGEIRHWHTVQCDPWNKGHWWASSGDGNASASNPNGQCRIYRSTDMGETWELMFSGSQRERTCCFVFEQDCIYYGMDSTNNTDENSIKIVKIDRSKLETDRANCREDVAVVGNAFAVYGMTRTFYPDGLIVWTQQEPNASYTPGRYILQFYDYATKKMYPIAYFDTSSIANSEYIGFFAGAKTQHCESGVIIAKPTRPLHQAKYGDSYVSTHIGLNLTM